MRLRPDRIIVNACLVLLAMSLHQPLAAEYLFLKNGGILNGRIIADTESAVVIQQTGGRPLAVDRSQVLRILFFDSLYLGKVVIRLTNGKSIEGYVVNEDTGTYTVRRVLESPDEFTLKREDVLFVTRTNPTGLQGRPAETWVRLHWYPPFMPPDHYTVYRKKKGDRAYVVAGTTTAASLTVRGLEVNQQYQFKVTAADRFGKESLPTNELTVNTNRPPAPPSRGRCRRSPSSAGQGLGVLLTWQASDEKEQVVTGYRIYQETEQGPSKIGETRAAEFRLENLNPRMRHHIIVRAVNQAGNESDDCWIDTGRHQLDLGVYARYLVPFHAMRSIIAGGYGGVAQFSLRNVLWYDLDLSVEAGCWNAIPASRNLHGGFTVPVMVALSYRFQPHRAVSIAPVLSAGIHYNSYRYKKKNYVFGTSGSLLGSYDSIYSRHTVDPITALGVELSWRLASLVQLQFRAQYGAYTEPGRYRDFLDMSAGVCFFFDARR